MSCGLRRSLLPNKSLLERTHRAYTTALKDSHVHARNHYEVVSSEATVPFIAGIFVYGSERRGLKSCWNGAERRIASDCLFPPSPSHCAPRVTFSFIANWFRADAHENIHLLPLLKWLGAPASIPKMLENNDANHPRPRYSLEGVDCHQVVTPPSIRSPV
ncbi:hypothetical protein BDZ89DRAFT_1147384 [Hymenopellis radicata]|nr:hypothetical protein BDZ89DRAFT_1147384 [Hymenopellis radicata]